MGRGATLAGLCFSSGPFRGDRLDQVKNSRRQNSSPRGWDPAPLPQAKGGAPGAPGWAGLWPVEEEGDGVPSASQVSQSSCCSFTGLHLGLKSCPSWTGGPFGTTADPSSSAPAPRLPTHQAPWPQSRDYPQLREGSAEGDGDTALSLPNLCPLPTTPDGLSGPALACLPSPRALQLQRLFSECAPYPTHTVFHPAKPSLTQSSSTRKSHHGYHWGFLQWQDLI